MAEDVLEALTLFVLFSEIRDVHYHTYLRKDCIFKSEFLRSSCLKSRKILFIDFICFANKSPSLSYHSKHSTRLVLSVD